jgi:hypothetical protein
VSHYLGQFTDDNADRITDEFDAAGIAWSAKSSGPFARLVFAADWGVRLFVTDDGDVERATAIARRIAPDGLA